MVERCGPLSKDAWRSPSDNFSVISTTDAPQCSYCLNKRHSGCFTSGQESKISTHPLLTHKLRPAKTCDLFSVAYDVLTNLVRQQSLLWLRNTSRLLGVRFRCLPPQWCSLLGVGRYVVRGGGKCARPHGWGGVCGQHREHTFCSPSDILGERR